VQNLIPFPSPRRNRPNFGVSDNMSTTPGKSEHLRMFLRAREELASTTNYLEALCAILTRETAPVPPLTAADARPTQRA
jgi:hypothetical protein